MTGRESKEAEGNPVRSCLGVGWGVLLAIQEASSDICMALRSGGKSFIALPIRALGEERGNGIAPDTLHLGFRCAADLLSGLPANKCSLCLSHNGYYAIIEMGTMKPFGGHGPVDRLLPKKGGRGEEMHPVLLQVSL